MNRDAERRILVFGTNLKSVQSSLAQENISASLWDDTSRASVVDARTQGYAKLRLENEDLLIVSTDWENASAVIERLRKTPQTYTFPLATLVETPPQAPETLQVRLKAIEQSIRHTHRRLRSAAEEGHLVSPAAQWLLDNAHALRSHVSDVAEALSPQILANTGPPKGGLPPVFAIAENLVMRLDGVISEDLIVDTIRDAQKDNPLLMDEIWLMAALVRLALVEFVANQGAMVAESQQNREEAHFWADRLASAYRISEETGARMLAAVTADEAFKKTQFIVAIAEQLQDDDGAMLAFQGAVESKYGKRLLVLANEEHQAEAQQGLTVANAFNSLRKLAFINFLNVFERTSRVDEELRRDPAAVYTNSDADTRNRARRAVQELAKESAVPEWKVAKTAVDLVQPENPTQNILFYLFADGRPLLEERLGAKLSWVRRLERSARKHATLTYISTIGLLTAGFCLVAMFLTIDFGSPTPWVWLPLWLLALFPLSELAIQVVNMLVISVFQASPLPKMDFNSGIPEDRTTLVVIPMMLGAGGVIQRELEKLEVRYLANPGVNVYFSLLSDFADADGAEDPNDEPLITELLSGIAALNQKYPGNRFLAFHRPRTWSGSENRWIGQERKRGKIEELNDYLTGHGSPGLLVAGTTPPNPIRYVITLDADTQLPPGSARRLIETISHPLNRVELDPGTKVRSRGFTIIQPRVTISLPGATATRFTRVMGDPHGTDPYCRLVSDSQQDLFGHAIFHGKAIYDVAAFRECLLDRFPAETILSHDLIEGAHSGVGLATDIELFESMPVDYASYSRRSHRWIRGDWQIAPWMFPKVPTGTGTRWMPNPLEGIQRWRIFDNLRRSLVAPASVTLLLVGWFLSGTPTVWTLVLILAVAIPALAIALDHIALRLQGVISSGRGSYDELVRATISLVFLPHQAWLSLDAIGRALYRMIVSRRNLLEWQTAESASQNTAAHSSVTMRQLTIISAVAIVIAFVQAGMLHGAAVPLLFLWASAPMVMIWLSRSTEPELLSELGRNDKLALRKIARKTWRFFDDLVGPRTNWLPPDNTQLALRIEVANRTSPTNIGLWMNSAQAAHDFGYITRDELFLRLERTVNTLERIDKYEGHLYNWYRTDDLAPLSPRYISTVDSGNLLASFWVQQHACRQMRDEDLVNSQRIWNGLSDTFANLLDASAQTSGAAFELRALRRLLRVPPSKEELPRKLRMVASLAGRLRDQLNTAGEATYWVGRFSQETIAWVEAIEKYLSWHEVLTRHPDSKLRRMGSIWVQLRRRALDWSPTLASLATGPTPMDSMVDQSEEGIIDPELRAWLAELKLEFARARKLAGAANNDWRLLGDRIDVISQAVNMSILFDPKRKLFGIGYAVGGPLEFTSFYDLLASECRIASLVSIAKGDVPLTHWARLGRPRTASPGGQSLLSWSGTMFEYLMPLLFVRSYPNSLLEHACRDAVLRQKEYGAAQGLPWGVSESAYSAIDANRTYQYHAFGIPALSLRNNQDSERVVAPYASALALQVSPKAALENLERLAELGLDGPMGFYEAIDFSQRPSPGSDDGVVIYCYMSHHVGMTLIAIDNLLNDDAMQSRFHSDLRIRAIESLLFERIPNQTLKPVEELSGLAPPAPRPETLDQPSIPTDPSATPAVQFLGNGRLSTAVNSAGSGYTRWKQFDLNRWRSDSASDQYGSYIVLRDVRESKIWSATQQPVPGVSGHYSVNFSSDKATFSRRVEEIESTLDVLVSPEEDVEIRRLRLTNWSGRERTIDLTTYMELALAPHAADRAHPAFSKMFVQTESPQRGLLVASRRRRSPEEPEIWVAQMLVGAVGAVSFETDREIFLGRANMITSANGFSRTLTNSTGSVVDPIFSLRCRLNMAPASHQEVSIVTLAADSRETLMTLVERIQRPQAIAQVHELAWNRVQLDLRYLRIGPAQVQQYQRLGSAMLYPDPNLRGIADRTAKDRLGQSTLWKYGISGDLPILTVTIPDTRSLVLLRELLLAHKYLRMRGLRFDLVILNQEAASYDRPLAQRIRTQVDALSTETGVDRPGGVFVRDFNTIPDSDANHLLAVAHVFLRGGRGALKFQLTGQDEQVPPVKLLSPTVKSEEPSVALPFLELPYFNGIGGFTKTGNEYAIYLAPGITTPLPWANVIAHEKFGTMVTESGLGFTWYGNSQANRLTPWHNDPVSDPQSEVIYLRDEESGAYWSPTASPVRERDAYRARHGQGYTVFEHNSHAIGQELTVFVPVSRNGIGENVKLYQLKLRNHSSRPRVLTATFFTELVLGANREDQQLRVQTSYDPTTGAIFASQWWTGSNAGDVAFVASSPKPASHSGDRLQFIGRNRNVSCPDAMHRIGLDNRTGPGLDPAGALQVRILLPQGGESQVVFMLGQLTSTETCRPVIARFQTPGEVEKALDESKAFWDVALGKLEVKTPVLSIDLLLNRWLLYQSLSCRFWGKSALYQSGGAIGFRDQLQDSLAMLYAFPQLTRAHILKAASRQFEEGDVQHWWHADSGLGVRTRCSDDLLWLPYVVAHYVDFTGDFAILKEQIGFLTAPELEPHEHEKMFVPALSNDKASLLQHCIRAIDRASRFGSHGIPLMGNGDWNDGMNLVGAEGKGESVWLAWFLCAVLHRFGALLQEIGDEHSALTMQTKSRGIADSIEASCWDGEWYLRAFFDTGEPLGSSRNAEARIDSLPQSWSVLSGVGQPLRARQAIDSARRQLVDPANKLVKLFTPPFNTSSPHPGYIMGYPPGLRENGGQYTHGSLWLAMAYAKLGDGTSAADLLQIMNPVERTRTTDDLFRYRGEPYVVAADVSSLPGRAGRSGWTWYTGSAAWMYRIWIESVLGITVRKDQLIIRPAVPESWSGFSFRYRFGSSLYEVEIVLNVGAAAENQVASQTVDLIDDGQVHHVKLDFRSVTVAHR